MGITDTLSAVVDWREDAAEGHDISPVNAATLWRTNH